MGKTGMSHWSGSEAGGEVGAIYAPSGEQLRRCLPHPCEQAVADRREEQTRSSDRVPIRRTCVRDQAGKMCHEPLAGFDSRSGAVGREGGVGTRLVIGKRLEIVGAR